MNVETMMPPPPTQGAAEWRGRMDPNDGGAENRQTVKSPTLSEYC